MNSIGDKKYCNNDNTNKNNNNNNNNSDNLINNVIEIVLIRSNILEKW